MSGTRMISRANLPCQPSPQHHHPNPTVRVPDPRAPRRCARQRGSGVLAACRRSGTSIFNKRRDGASPFDPYLAVREQGYAVDEVGADREAERIGKIDALPIAVSSPLVSGGERVVVGSRSRTTYHHRRVRRHRRFRPAVKYCDDEQERGNDVTWLELVFHFGTSLPHDDHHSGLARLQLHGRLGGEEPAPRHLHEVPSPRNCLRQFQGEGRR